MTNPVSIEQAEGPKKVKAFLSGSIPAPALSTTPHKYELPVLKFHVDSCSPLAGLHKEQENSAAEEGSCGADIESTILLVVQASQLYSFLQPVFTHDISKAKKKTKKKYGFG
jgi:hypothetical protein